MSIPKMIAIIIIFFVSCIGWFVLGTVTSFRSFDSFSRLGSQVEGLWGTPLIQKAPAFSVHIPGVLVAKAGDPIGVSAIGALDLGGTHNRMPPVGVGGLWQA